MEPHRGREAARPADIPPPGWKDILTRAWRRIGADNHSLVAAGVAFYAMLAVFPALAAFVSIFGLVADPHDGSANRDSSVRVYATRGSDTLARCPDGSGQ